MNDLVEGIEARYAARGFYMPQDIQDLAAEIERLRAALQDISDRGSEHTSPFADGFSQGETMQGKRARKALGQSSDKRTCLNCGDWRGGEDCATTTGYCEDASAWRPVASPKPFADYEENGQAGRPPRSDKGDKHDE